MAVLDVRNLIYWYRTRKGAVRAVDNVSFKLEQGETIAVVGESGCGKTSTANAILRLLPKNVERYEGEIWFDGQDIMTYDNEEFRRKVRWKGISMVLQGALNALNPTVRAGAQVAEPLIVHYDVDRDEAMAQASEAMKRVGLPADIVRRYPHELSGGMKQRVVIAMALILKPKVVILDEPTSALDVMTQTNIINLLKEMKAAEGLSYLFITHDLGLASDLADHVAIMYAGEIDEIGPADHVFVHPKHPYTGRLLASVPRLRSEETPEFIPGVPPDLSHPPPGCRFHLRCPVAFEKCGWVAEEFVDRLRLLKVTMEGKEGFPRFASFEAKGSHTIVLRPDSEPADSLATSFDTFVKASRDDHLFLKSVRSITPRTARVDVTLHEGAPPPLVGEDWKAACWLAQEAATHDTIPA
jgi:peptide/nickel transport system ATP-binding protein